MRHVQGNHRQSRRLGAWPSVAAPALGGGRRGPWNVPTSLNVPIFAIGRATPLRLTPPTPIRDPDLTWLEV